MWPGQQRVEELRRHFGVRDGQFWSEYRYKNLNWHFTKGNTVNREHPGEWFCFGDIRDEDIPRLQEILEPGELLVLGWKDLSPASLHDEFFGDGGGVRIAIAKNGVVYDVRRDGVVKESR